MQDLVSEAPKVFFCSVPIGLMRNPMSTCDGQTFECTTVEQW